MDQSRIGVIDSDRREGGLLQAWTTGRVVESTASDLGG
jgi:hypothetical protein